MRTAEIEFRGHRALQLDAGEQRLVIVTSVGPRIAWFGFADRENLLYWDDTGTRGDGAWRLYGGHRLWTTRPGADESAEVNEPDNAACEIERSESAIRVTAPPTSAGIAKQITIEHAHDAWVIRHALRNASALLWSGGAWALTCTAPGHTTEYSVPLGGGPTSWDLATIVIPLRWGPGHTSRLEDPQIVTTGDGLRIRPSGTEGKRMVLAPQGRIVMLDSERGRFTKHAAYDRDATYPLATNLAIYLGPERFMVELETMGALRTLVPGDSLVHVETWTLDRV